MTVVDMPTTSRPARPSLGANSGLNILFLSGFPLVLWLFQGSAVLIATAIFQMFLLSCALRLIASGLAAEARYDAAIASRAPRVPCKLLGAVLIGVTVFLLAGHHFFSLLAPAMLGLSATGLTVAAFGPDPMRAKGMDNPEEVKRLVLMSRMDQIELDLASTVHRIAGLGDADLTRRTEAAQDLIHHTIAQARDDAPMLDRAHRPIAKFVSLFDAEAERLEVSWEGDEFFLARRRFIAKLDVLTQSFATLARKSGFIDDPDALDDEAAQLLHRMPHESAA